jgi:CRISPR-associated protein Cas2
MEIEMFVVVSYDIPEDKRRTKVMKLMKNYGAHVQYSVFECELRETAYKKMRERLKQLVSPKHDSVRFYFLDEDAVKKIEVIGVKPVERAKEFYVVG